MFLTAVNDYLRNCFKNKLIFDHIILDTCFPGCGMQLCFDDSSIDDWDCNTPRMVMDRGYNMR